MAGQTRRNWHYIELFLAAIMFLMANLLSFLTSFIHGSILLLNLAITILFIAMAAAFVHSNEDLDERVVQGRRQAKKQRYSSLIHALFALITACYVLLLALNPSLLIAFVKTFWIFGIFFVAFLPVFFLVFLGVYIIRDGNRKAAILLLAAFLILLAYYSLNLLFTGFKADDEELILFKSVSSVFNGTNPYATSFSKLLYENARNMSFTLTTDNALLSTLQYPALFLLSFIPFYFASAPTLYNMANIDLPLQACIFSFLLIVAIAALLDKKDLIKPRLSMIAIFMFTLNGAASITVPLMIALLLLAYVKLESRYSWLLLGLCVAIQEELWLPVLLLVAYSFNNQGFRKGVTNAIGAATTFIVINSYFIALSPGAYFSAVFTPLSSFIFPNGFSSIGFPITEYFPVLLSTYGQGFILTSILLAFIMMYWNRKELIPLFSAIPFLVLDHSLNSYYVTFILFFFFALLVRGKRNEGWLKKSLKKKEWAAYLAVAVLLVSIALVFYSSHLALESGFGVSTGGAELLQDRANLSSTYRTTINYGNLANNTVYVVAIAEYSSSKIGIIGVINESIIENPNACGYSDYVCMVNVNRIVLPRNLSSYPLSVTLKWDNETTPITDVAVEIYNGKYFYFGASASNMSS